VVRPQSCRVIYYFDTPTLGKRHQSFGRVTLQNILTHKDKLRVMVTSREWVSSAYAKDSKGKKFVESVLDSLFWEECAIIVRMSEPLVRVL